MSAGRKLEGERGAAAAVRWKRKEVARVHCWGLVLDGETTEQARGARAPFPPGEDDNVWEKKVKKEIG
jgi:hypothetical protein